MIDDVTTPRYDVKIIPNVYVPTQDGTRIAVELYMPDAEGKFPAVFDYYPYRKSDLVGYRRLHYYCARTGEGPSKDFSAPCPTPQSWRR